ncbi:MAG: glycoside hydrolase family 25 [Ruminococcus sp.]|nr:glycoside hydrolase family 25 [Ruminococcus sp.]
MKHILTSAFIAGAALLLAGCGNKVSTHSDPDLKVSSVTTSTSTEKTSPSSSSNAVTTTTSTATTAVTTTTVPQPPADLILKGMDTVEVYTELTLDEFITDKNVELSEGSALLNTADPGEYQVDIKYISNGNEFTEKLTYNVADTTPPLLLNSGWNPYHVAGKDFDLSNYVGFADNYDRNVSLTYTGDIDPNTLGNYPLHAIATDSSGNSTEWDVTISVVNSVPVPPDDRTRVPFSDFAAAYGGEGRRLGLDISAWQADVDFNALKNAGCDFVIMRAGYCYGDPKTDDYFFQNLERARAAGMDYSIYFYFTDNNEEEVREHARWLADVLGGEPVDLPIAFDWEDFGTFQQFGMNIKDLNDLYAAFRDELSKYGYDTMLYSSRNFLRDFWTEKTKSLGPVWLAHYVDETNYDGDYYIWQQSSCGRIDGIAGDVDMNVLYE